MIIWEEERKGGVIHRLFNVFVELVAHELLLCCRHGRASWLAAYIVPILLFNIDKVVI